MEKHSHRISGTKPGSIACEMGIEPGDSLLTINGEQVFDIIDYLEWNSHEKLEVIICKSNGEEWILEIEKESDEDLGIIFQEPLMDSLKRCSNRCIFCFIDQLPPNMRHTLYQKDDDWRLSFLMGNYITLTNLTSKDIKRITEKRISPLYVSIHTTNPELRKRMIRNKRAGEIIKILRIFEQADITIHSQIVLCKGWNDGIELERTINELWEFRSIVKSVAVVPVGLTCYRDHLEPITPFDKHSANLVINQVEKWQKHFQQLEGYNFVFAADEFYILANRRYPDYDNYEDFCQIENGVGLVVKFHREFDDALKQVNRKANGCKTISLITGISAYSLIKAFADKINQKTGIVVHVYQIENSFFGDKVTVAGLITGKDIIQQLKDKKLGEQLLIPDVMLRKGENVFLDGMTLHELEEAVGVPVHVVPVDGKALVEAVTL